MREVTMFRQRFLFVLPLILLLTVGCDMQDAAKKPVQFSVDLDSTSGPNTGFWKALGYDFLFKIVNEPDGREFLDRAQQTGSVVYYRTHYTFNNRASGDKKAGGNIGGNVLTVDKNGNPHYDFSRVNTTFREYVKRGMKPIVEFDFYPDGMSASSARRSNDEAFESRSGPPASWEQWQDLLDRFMQDLVSTFGKKELRTWYFEVWNEPDGWDRDELPDFYRLYDVFAHTVKSYDPAFKVGGPACYHLSFLKEFLDHVVYGKNYVTGRKGSPIDFVSFHLYGISGSWLKPAPDIYPTVSRFTIEMLWWQRLMKEYPSLKNVEIHLNEWGLSSHGDSKFVDQYPQLEYRNSEVSALFLVKLVDNLYAINDNYDFPTDLMLYWGAWFNAATGPIFWGSRDLMTSGDVPKPILTGYEMLAKLGDERLKVNGPKPGGRFGVIATKSGNQVQLLAYNYNETDDHLEEKDPVELAVTNLPVGKDFAVEEYWLDRTHHNTYRAWEAMGKPAANEEVIKQLKQVAELSPDKTYQISDAEGKVVLKAAMPRHSMRLYVVHVDEIKN